MRAKDGGCYPSCMNGQDSIPQASPDSHVGSRAPSARPPIVSVIGDGSNSGKTTLVAGLIAHFRRDRAVGAMKISTGRPDHTCARTGLACGCLRFDGEMRLLEGEAYTRRPGKDTEQMHNAGADPVWWMQTTSDRAEEAGREVELDLRGINLLVVEGAALARAGRSDFLLAVRRTDRPSKTGFEHLWERADLQLESRSETEEEAGRLFEEAKSYLMRQGL